MAAEILLLDTGPFVSLLDRAQRRHADCVAFLRGWSGEVVTTEAVVTEATHLMSRVSGGAVACLQFVLEGGATLVPTSTATLRRITALVRRYADTPMDFADATLVALAEDLATDLVFSLDRRGFEIYRVGRKPFRIVP